MASIAEIRQQYPGYSDMSDDQLAGALHQKFYADMPRDTFNQKIGLAATGAQLKAGEDPTVDPVIDTVKSTGIGAVKSTLKLGDLPGMVTKLGGRAGAYVGDLITGNGPGNGPTTFANRFRPPSNAEPAPSASKVWQNAIEKQTGPFYEPKTYAGEWGETVGGFAPNVIGGPGGIGTRVATQMVLPALTTEAAGALTKGTKYETPARIAAALLTGPAASKALAGRAAPTAEQLAQSYRTVVKDPAIQSIPVTPAQQQGLVRDMEARLFPHDRINAPVPFNRMDYLENLPNPSVTVKDVQAVRQRLSADERAARGNQITGAPEAASRSAKKSIDDFLNTVDPRYKAANTDYAVSKASEYLTGKADVATNRAAAANSGNNLGNALRQRMVDILASPRASKQFTQPQLDNIEKIAQGSWASNTARAWANRLGGGGGIGQTLVASGLLGGGGYYAGGNEGAAGGLALALAGRGLKGLENGIVRRQVDRADASIRRGAPGVAVPQAPMSTADIARALIRSGTAAQQLKYDEWQ